MILTLARHEFLKLFKSGKFWKLLALCQCILGLIFYWLTEEFLTKTQSLLLETHSSFGITEEVIHPMLAWATLLFFFIVPLLATQSITQERKQKTLDLYLSSPISASQIILGKFFGIFALQIILFLPIIFMILLTSLYNTLDIGQLLTGLLGFILIQATALSLGLFIACHAQEPLVASFTSFVLLVFLSLIEWVSRFFSSNLSFIADFALLHHCKNLLSGLIDTRDILYYVLFSLIFLMLSVWRLKVEPRFKN